MSVYSHPTDPAKRRSAALTDGVDRAGARAMLKAVGFTDDDLAKPLVGVATFVVMRPFLVEIARRKVLEEASWTDHAAALEEGIAGRDDLRTSLGQDQDRRPRNASPQQAVGERENGGWSALSRRPRNHDSTRPDELP